MYICATCMKCDQVSSYLTWRDNLSTLTLPHKMSLQSRACRESLRSCIDNKNLTHFTNRFFVPELASSLFDNAVKTLSAQAQARALPEQH